MKIEVKENHHCDETHILIECSSLDSQIKKIIHYLNSLQKTITCKKGKDIFQVSIHDIYYIESVDDKTFVYLKDNFYECSYKLYELETFLKNHDFLRINKSCVLNLSYLESVKVLIYGKYEATLVNNEKLVISRKYMPEFKKAFGM